MRAIGLALILSCISIQSSATMIEITVEVTPEISHTVSSGGYPFDSITVELPDVRLDPGDLLRISVFFTGDQMIRVTEFADLVRIQPSFFVEGLGLGMEVEHDGALHVSILESVDITDPDRDIPLTIQELPLARPPGTVFVGVDAYYASDGSIHEGSCIGDFMVDFLVPTVADGKPFQTQDFTSNQIMLSGRGFSPGDVPLLEVIPEPGTFTLLLLGAILLRTRRPNHQ